MLSVYLLHLRSHPPTIYHLKTFDMQEKIDSHEYGSTCMETVKELVLSETFKLSKYTALL